VICSFLDPVISAACACSLPSQEMGRAAGAALSKQCGWRAELRDPDLEVVVDGLWLLPGLPLTSFAVCSAPFARGAVASPCLSLCR